MPGRSTTSTYCSAWVKWPLLRSTVTPGQLPVVWRMPVNALNRADFPQFGLPAMAMVRWSLPWVAATSVTRSPPWRRARLRWVWPAVMTERGFHAGYELDGIHRHEFQAPQELTDRLFVAVVGIDVGIGLQLSPKRRPKALPSSSPTRF